MSFEKPELEQAIEEAFDASKGVQQLRALQPDFGQPPGGPDGPETSDVPAFPEDRPPHLPGAASLEIPVEQ